MLIKCLVSVTIPGTIIEASQHPTLNAFISALKEKNIEGGFVDTIAGWGNLNQNWFEFEVDVETDFDFVKLECFSHDEWYGIDDLSFMVGWRKYFETGQLLMMIHYIGIDGNGEKKYIPHH